VSSASIPVLHSAEVVPYNHKSCYPSAKGSKALINILSSHRNRRARCMTCGPGPSCQRLDRWLRRSRGGAQPRGSCTLLMRRFAFLTVGCGEDEGAHYRGVVACSLCDDSPSSRFGPACMTCEAWPPCHRMGTLVRIGGDLARDASGRE
jgi:hypothetical protein